MKILSMIKKIAYSTAFDFTVTLFVFMGMFTLFYDNLELTSTKAIPLSQYPWLLLFSFIVAVLNTLLCAKKLNVFLRVGVHYAGIMASIYIIFIKVFGMGQNSNGQIALIAVFSVIYAVIMLLCYFVRRAFSSAVKALTNDRTSKAKAAKESDAGKGSKQEGSTLSIEE